MAISFHLYLRADYKKKNGEHPIYLRITNNRKHKYVSTGFSVKEKDWNPDKETVRRSHPNYKTINESLSNKIKEGQIAQLELSRNGHESAKAISERLKSKQKADFFEIANQLRDEAKLEKKFYPQKHIKVVLNKVENFEKNRYLPLKRIDTAYLEKFELFLKIEYKNNPNTIRKDFRVFRKVFKRAIKLHLVQHNPFLNFEGSKRKKARSKAKLSFEQIQGIEKLIIESGSGKWHARNAFLFSFYSGGIRFGDICCLQWSNIQNDRLSYKMNKNDKAFSTQLNEYQKHILSLYTGAGKQFIFPFLNSNKDYSDPIEVRREISSKNALVNKNLKKIVSDLNDEIDKKRISSTEIIENVSFHVSRHSFAQHAVESGLDVYGLMQALRHSNIETTERYLKGLDEELADKAMKQVF